jgi:hypothetical protein
MFFFVFLVVVFMLSLQISKSWFVCHSVNEQMRLEGFFPAIDDTKVWGATIEAIPLYHSFRHFYLLFFDVKC